MCFRSPPTPPPGAGLLTQIYYLILPSVPLVLVLFGYIARMARAGTVTALEADYTRTAVLKGLPYRTVIWRHVLRNALLPTITVIATQAGYLIGGLVVVETLFHYQGIGGLIYRRSEIAGFPDAGGRHADCGDDLRVLLARGGSAVRSAQPAAALRGARVSAAALTDGARPFGAVRRSRACCCARRRF